MRIKTPVVDIRGIKIGGDHPIVIQSMTNTDTAAAAETAAQCIELADAGSEIVRITVNDAAAALAVPKIRKLLDEKGYEHLPLVGDFHFNGGRLLTDFPECAAALDKYRINPGNIGYGHKHDDNFKTMIRIAIERKKSVRIGVNWGSLDRELLTGMMNENARNAHPKSDREIIIDACVESAILSARLAEKTGLERNKMVLSVKMSDVRDVTRAYERLARRMKEHPYALHLGLTEAGSGMKGVIASSAALAILLQKGIGDTIRISLTPQPGHSRTEEVESCRVLLQSMGLRHFKPQVTSCPGCGRTNSDRFQRLAAKVNEYIEKRMPDWEKNHDGIEKLSVAVMGCIVNGPGEAMHADIGISLPGKGEKTAQVFIRGKLLKNLHGENIEDRFLELLESFVAQKYMKPPER